MLRQKILTKSVDLKSAYKQLAIHPLEKTRVSDMYQGPKVGWGVWVCQQDFTFRRSCCGSGLQQSCLLGLENLDRSGYSVYQLLRWLPGDGLLGNFGYSSPCCQVDSGSAGFQVLVAINRNAKIMIDKQVYATNSRKIGHAGFNSHDYFYQTMIHLTVG